MSQELRLEIRTRLGESAVSWDRLADASGVTSPFLRSWWLDSVVSGTGRFLLCFSGTALVGGCALQEIEWHRIPCIQFVGAGPLEPDHLDVVAAPDWRVGVVRLVRQWLRRPGCRVVDLEGLDSDAALLRGDFATKRAIEIEQAPFIDMPDGSVAFWDAQRAKRRAAIRRTDRILRARGARFRRCDRTDFALGLEQLRALHLARFPTGSSFIQGWPQFRAAAVAGFEAGEVQLGLVLAQDGSAVAAEVALVVGARACAYQTGRTLGRDWPGAGNWLTYQLMLSNPEWTEYDALRGREQYKDRLATGHRRIMCLRFGVGLRAQAAVAASRAIALSKASQWGESSLEPIRQEVD